MSSNAPQRLSHTSALLRSQESPPEADDIEDAGCFGWLRGARERAVMLELRKRDGSRLAIGYGWIERIEFDPTAGIRILGPSISVNIMGTHLDSVPGMSLGLFSGLTTQRVSWIAEDTNFVSDVANNGLVRVASIIFI